MQHRGTARRRGAQGTSQTRTRRLVGHGRRPRGRIGRGGGARRGLPRRRGDARLVDCGVAVNKRLRSLVDCGVAGASATQTLPAAFEGGASGTRAFKPSHGDGSGRPCADSDAATVHVRTPEAMQVLAMSASSESVHAARRTRRGGSPLGHRARASGRRVRVRGDAPGRSGRAAATADAAETRSAEHRDRACARSPV